MTRAEELQRKQARNRKEYEATKEKRRERYRKWYWENHDFALAKAAATRNRLREKAVVSHKPIQPSIEALEETLPYQLRINKALLRKEFLKIPILERPTYDIYLKLKTIEYYKQHERTDEY